MSHATRRRVRVCGKPSRVAIKCVINDADDLFMEIWGTRARRWVSMGTRAPFPVFPATEYGPGSMPDTEDD